MESQRKDPPSHPGSYIKQSVLPKNLSVKSAAEMLDVGRPALSNLLNGKAALSPEMAMRVEKAFQVDASFLLEMQARYDEFLVRAGEDDIAVRAYAPAYLQITALQIAAWADTLDARAQLPALLRTLVHSTGTNLTAVDFPAFDNSQRKGWDGKVTSGSATPWIPRGRSGWEFGCNKNPQAKAESDYQIRTAGISAKERKSTTFVFVTPRNWAGKDNWSKDKRTRDEWKDVRAIDASDLEQWLEQSVPAQTRMREFLVGPGQEITTFSEIWDEWARATEPELSKELFAPAAERHQKQLETWLKAPPTSPFVVTADSTLEALAFLSCALERLEEKCAGAYERAVTIRSLEAFRTITRVSSNFIAIVASSEVEQALAGLQKKTHTIIVRGRNTVTDDANIALDLLGHEPFREALHGMGLDDAWIERLSRESARSPTILRRRLAQAEAVKFPPWANDNAVARALIPLIFVGAWDSSAEADKEILGRLTNGPYEETERKIAELQTIDEPPIWSIGHLRGVVSKVDALYAAHRALTKEDLENFLIAAEFVLSEQDPALELPEDQRWAANLHGKSRDHSSALRQGLCDTLVLLAVHGNALIGERLGIDLEARISGVVRRLLTPSAASTWHSQKNDLPQYAEAAPDAFLSIIETDLNSEDPQIAALFAPADTGIFGDCPRSGMLWALESLAWKPKRLVRVTSILAKLCAWQIDDNWANKPMASLNSIFRFWMPQTSASLDQRNRALDRLTKKFPEVGWQVCVDQFDPGSTFGNYSNKPRWRTDAYDAGEVTTVDEAQEGQRTAVELAINWPAHDERTLCDLVGRLKALSPDHHNRVWELIAAWNDTGPTDSQKAVLREQIRRCALTRRSRRHRHGINDAERKRARQVYAELESQNPVVRHQWLFLKHWVDESADEIEDAELDYQKREERIARKRRDALQEVWAESGLGGIEELCRSGDASSEVGWHMAEVCTEVQQAADFLQNIMAEQSDDMRDKSEQCIAGFLAKLDLRQRDATLKELLARLGSDDDARIRLLCCAPFDDGTWQHIDRLHEDLKRRYWEEVNPRWGRHDASAIETFVDELLNVDRPHAAFHAAHMDWQRLDSPRLIRLLTEVATNGAEPPAVYRLDTYGVSEALKTLEQRGDTSRDDLARLEFLFINVLDHSEHGIRNLEAQLAETPALFMQALAYAFKRNDGREDPAEWQTPNFDNREAAANACYVLLTSANRIPGTQPDGRFDLKKLKDWLEQVRTLTRECGRAEIGDQMIGQLLSHCPPGDDGIWPCEPVREAIDDLGSQEIATGMLVGIQNARGAILRGEGGAQERELAEQYRSWSREVAFEHPFTASMLEQIAADYDHDAKWWDNQDSVRQRIGI